MPSRLSWRIDWPTSAISGGFQPPECEVRVDTYLRCAGVQLLHQPPSAIRPHYRDREQHGIDAIEHASVAGENRAGILHSGAAPN